MKSDSKSKCDVSCTKGVQGKKQGKISIPLCEMITAISHLGDKISELDKDGQWRSDDSLWSQLAAPLACRLSIQNSLRIRKYIYTTWNRKSSKLRSHFINHTSHDGLRTNLQELPSIPSYTKTFTRSKKSNLTNPSVEINEQRKHLIEFSYEEWRNIYKKDIKSHYMDKSWTDVFYDKLVGCKLVTCSLIFIKSVLRKQYSRKRNTALFKCHAKCQNSTCPSTVRIAMAKPVTVGQDVVFRVQVNGTQRHDNPSESTGRRLKGIKRESMVYLNSN